MKAARRAIPATDSAESWFRNVLAVERDALDTFIASSTAHVAAIVALLAADGPPIVCAGIGKSGLIAAKVAATFSSLGTPAFFLNAAEAAHGDLGAVQSGNVVLLFSNSGATEELTRILPLLQARRCRLVGIVGKPGTPLAKAVDHLILADVAREADHIGMAPTASTTLQMAIGDALAVAVSRVRNFTRDDFLRHHPAGLLGRQAIPIRHLMRTGDQLPTVLPHMALAETVSVISSGRIGAACVVDWEGRLLGYVSDGDIRRLIQQRGDLYATPASGIMQANPKVIDVAATVGEALALVMELSVSVLPVVDGDRRLAGIIHVHDLMGAGK